MATSVTNSFLLSSVRWDIFGTLTFRKLPSDARAARLGVEWLGALREKFHYRASDFVWFLRVEHGERLGRVHLHCLICVKPCHVRYFIMPKGQVPSACRIWRHGISTFRKIDSPQDPALVYTVKDLDGADDYELRKTSRCLNVIASDALQWAALRSVGGTKPGHEVGLSNTLSCALATA